MDNITYILMYIYDGILHSVLFTERDKAISARDTMRENPDAYTVVKVFEGHLIDE